jgi:hypothetical protein
LEDKLPKIKELYQKIKPQAMNLDPSQKILLTDEDVDKIVEPYLKVIPEASELKEVVHLYVETSKEYNDKLLQLTSLNAKAGTLQAQIDQQKEQSVRLNSQMIATTDPSLPVYANAMNRLYEEATRRIVNTVYLLKLATAYYNMTVFQFDLQDYKLETLKENKSLALTDFKDARALEYGGAPLPFNSVVYILDEKNAPGLIKRLKAMGKVDPKSGVKHSVNFHVPVDAFPGKCNVFATGINIILHGVKKPDSGKVTLYLNHPGTSIFKDANTGATKRFVHVSRSVTLSYAPAFTGVKYDPWQNNLGDKSDGYLLRSPCTIWTLTIDPAINAGMNLSSVDRIRLEFQGNYDSPCVTNGCKQVPTASTTI